ncbi:MAG: serine hydrolase [Burkholderiales bacterium]|nr:serine hydrolase [Burkholderiales bacterium]OUT77548.1 MAG: serine hydrolase [Betaproteobacteria bacterium TMED22]|tara:strand:+ start:28179 stop:29258 length:1080 start_codon:yes stop_codon:yes gene_type:complete
MTSFLAEDILEDCISFALNNEIDWTRDNSSPWGIHEDDMPPWNSMRGPVFPRGGVSGAVVLNGENLISWGDFRRPDLTFSVAKTYLAVLCGLAFDAGLIRDIDECVETSLPGIGFDSSHNKSVTWRHLLHQTSEWEGVCCGVPDQVDHYRYLSFQDSQYRSNLQKGTKRKLNDPGTYWEYNDVRINQLSLALLHLFRQPLDEVFEQRILAPIGCSCDWAWTPYADAHINIDGISMPTLPGGSHWGGGVRISSQDQVLIGQLLLQKGRWRADTLVSENWINSMFTPSHLAPYYGYLTWLNTDRILFPRLPESSIFAIGAGGSYTWIDPELNAVTIVRWINPFHAEAFMVRLREALITLGT